MLPDAISMNKSQEGTLHYGTLKFRNKMLTDAISMYKWQEWSLYHGALKFRDKKSELGFQ